MTEKTSPESSSTEIGLSSKGKQKNKASKIPVADYLKLVIALVIFVAGIWVYYGKFLNIPDSMRSIILLVSGLVGFLLVLFWCQFGRNFLFYLRDSYAEFKKVVWLSRGESAKITVRVVVFVTVLSAFIYCVDSLISVVFNMVLLRG